MAVNASPRHWIATVSREHVLIGVKGGFCQACHGKKAPLSRMQKGDWLIYYSPKESMGGDKSCQKFTAIGKIADDNIYSFKMSEGFVPFRRNVTYLTDTKEPSIRPLLDKLSFIKDKQRWGAQFRFGILEIPQSDFEIIYRQMVSDVNPSKKCKALKGEKSMDIELTHTEFAKTDPESVWQMWSDVSTWSTWDHGIEWCKLEKGNRFELRGEASLLPKGSPVPLNICFIECTPNKSFTDEARFNLGIIQFSHEVVPYKDGVKITHSLKYVPTDATAKKDFEQRMLPKIQKELPISVKALAQCLEKQGQKT